MYCQNCGAEVKGKFCPECGSPAESTTPITQTQSESADVQSKVIKPKKKSSCMGRILGIVITLIVLIIVIAQIASRGNSTTSGSDSTSPKETQSQTKKKKYITLADFEKCKSGMTYEEVVKILGYEGELTSEVDIGDSKYHTVIYTYYGSSLGANANFTFQGGKLTAKAQFGLK